MDTQLHLYRAPWPSTWPQEGEPPPPPYTHTHTHTHSLSCVGLPSLVLVIMATGRPARDAHTRTDVCMQTFFLHGAAVCPLQSKLVRAEEAAAQSAHERAELEAQHAQRLQQAHQDMAAARLAADAIATELATERAARDSAEV